MSLTILYWLLLAVMLLGVIGAFIPGLPGVSLILGAIVIWGVTTGFSGVGWPLGIAVAVLILSGVVGFLATYLGAVRTGASKWSQIGAVAGLLLGFFGLLPALPFGGPLLGILIGPVLGAFLGEFFYRGDLELGPRFKLAAQVSIGIVVGSLIGNLVEGLLAILAVAAFVATTWSQVGV
ncbi:DUF456 domain-containing protein [Leptolyngbya sp. FACHB-261]|uniref:DUF456 domain-containing protein n=1 Tax=Leptolyngbya sp. FACHB-261 TaxID=2692806 RepID=UPI001686162B|nr:DUF456 family protein [Leptolyngbya sp. FACHB-261]MBD2101468.1 DUF456 family protein [Leptolyngbya sp. FACHB-261]